MLHTMHPEKAKPDFFLLGRLNADWTARQYPHCFPNYLETVKPVALDNVRGRRAMPTKSDLGDDETDEMTGNGNPRRYFFIILA